MAKRKHEEPKGFERTCTTAVERGDDEPAKGTFGAVLATNGEAADGHILHIAGNKTPSRMPLLFGHRSDAMTPSLGSVTKPKKGKTADGKNDALRTTQVINMDGDGQMAEIRRNIAILVHSNDLNAMSVRWVPDEVVRRIDLPRSHYAHIDSEQEPRDSERYWGYFHKRSRNEEGSIVAIGADPQALMGRAQELKGAPSSVFFRALAHSIESGDRADGMAKLGTAFTAYQEAMSAVRSAGVAPDDLAMMFALDAKPAEMVPYHFIDREGNPRSTMILRTAWEALQSESSEAYRAAIALHQEAPQARAAEPEPKPESESLTPEEMDAEFNRVYPHREPKPKAAPAPKQTQKRTTIADLDPEAFYAQLGGAIGMQVRDAVARATGKVLD